VILTQYSLEYWPQKLILTNFKPKAFDFSLRAPANQKTETPIEWFKKWLYLQSPFSPSAYTEVRTLFAATGDDRAAEAIGYAGRDRELAESMDNMRVSTFVYLLFSKILIGYGYQMWLPVLWTATFVFIGGIVFRNSVEARRAHMRTDAFFYSLDMFLPLLQLRKRHSDVDLRRAAVRNYFYVHKVAGWIIGSFIIAGLTGFTK
jgi:hypothetical protein